jgi:hypothetical protein
MAVALPRTVQAAASHRVPEMPSVLASGPVRAYPSGMSATEPSQS